MNIYESQKEGQLRSFHKQCTDKILELNLSYSPFAYTIIDLGGERTQGKFFADQIQSVEFPNIVKIVKIIKREKQKKVDSFLIVTNIYHKLVSVYTKDMKKSTATSNDNSVINTDFISKVDFYLH